MTLIAESPAPLQEMLPSKGPSGYWRLSRITTSNRFIPEIDGFRFLAIAGVMLFHDFGHVLQYNGFAELDPQTGRPRALTGIDLWLSYVIGSGSIGVEFFFVISGFILGLPFAEHHLLGKPKPVLKSYLWRRVTRLEPPYLIHMVLWSFVILLYKNVSFTQSMQHLLASLFYVHNQVYAEGSLINNNAWSLEVEIQFYLLAPLLTYVFAVSGTRTRRLLLLGLTLTCSILNNTVAPDTYRYQASILQAIQYFLVGFLLADIFLLNRDFLQAKRLVWDVIAAVSSVVIIVTLNIGGGRWGTLTWHLPFCMLLIFIAGFKGPILNRFFRLAPVYLIGGMCYTIYLYHGHLVSFLSVLTHRFYVHSLPVWVNYIFQLAMHAAVVLPACVILFLLIERPCMKRDWPQLLWQRLFRPASNR